MSSEVDRGENLDFKGANGKKIRKRNGSSSSSSATLARKNRFKRAILMGKRGGFTTPAPAWESHAPLQESVGKARDSSVSARKLAATLWEIDQVPKCHQKMIERDRSELGHHRTKSAVSQKLQLTHHCYLEGSLMDKEPEDQSRRKKRVAGGKSGLKELVNGLAASKELLKLLRKVSGHEDRRSTLSSSLFSALRSELDRALSLADHLAAPDETDEEAKRIIHVADLLAEKRLRRQTERLNKRLGAELAETKASLETERRAKQILEQTCDELARGVGEAANELREEVERERQMLHVADVLREERVQMKLSEARFEFEEKSAAVEELRTELEAYLSSRVGAEMESPKFEKIKELEAYLKEINFGGDGESDSGESDMRSIELNVDNNGEKSFKWSFEEKEKEKERERVQWGNICLNRSSVNGGDSEIGEEGEARECDGEVKRYRSLKDLADHILSGSDIARVPGFASPTRQWG